MSAIALSYIPLLFILSALGENKEGIIKFPYILILIILLIYSVAFFAVYLEICNLVFFFIEERKHSKFEKALKVIGAILTAGAMISVFFINTAPAPCFVFAGAIGLLLIIELVHGLKAKTAFASLKRKRTWFLALVIVLAVTAIFIAADKSEESKNKPDPQAPAVCIQIQ